MSAPDSPTRPTPPTREDALALMEKLAPIQAAKGYYFNPVGDVALELLEQLLVTKARYGYMTCPCRLVSGVRENDKDIICPCAYRAEDVAEFGTCFCALYVDEKHRETGPPDVFVPERRPVEKMLF